MQGVTGSSLGACPSQNQLAACARALESSEELLETANQTLQATDSEDFPQVGVSEATRPGCDTTWRTPG